MTARPTQETGFLTSLFDFDFKTLIAGRVVRVVYILAVIGGGLWALFTLWAGIRIGGGSAVLALITAPLGFLLFTVGTRLYLEVVLVLFKIADHAKAIEAVLTSQSGTTED